MKIVGVRGVGILHDFKHLEHVMKQEVNGP